MDYGKKYIKSEIERDSSTLIGWKLQYLISSAQDSIRSAGASEREKITVTIVVVCRSDPIFPWQ